MVPPTPLHKVIHRYPVFPQLIWRCIQLWLIHVTISANITELEIVLEVIRGLGTLITILVCKT